MGSDSEPAAASIRLVTFALAGQSYGLPLAAVECVQCAIEVTPLPQAPAAVLGVVNIRGDVRPVFDLRRRFGLPERELELTDQLILAHTSRRSVALVADAVHGVLERSADDLVGAEQILPDLSYVAGVVKLGDGMVLIHDLEAFLSLEEERQLADALPPD